MLFRSLWDCLLAPSQAQAPAYRGYSYERLADLYQLVLPPEQTAALLRDAVRLAPRSLRPALSRLPATTRIVFVCPRRTT